MTHDTIDYMQAQVTQPTVTHNLPVDTAGLKPLRNPVKEAVAREREACAQLAEQIGAMPKLRDGSGSDWKKIAAAIRARGNP